MIPDPTADVDAAAGHIAAGRFYVEARVGSANYRNNTYGDPVRLLMDGGGVNTTPDAMLVNLARAVLAAQPAEPSWLTDLRELRSALAAVIAASPAYRRPIGAEHSLARLIQGEQIAAEDAARTILARTEIYDAAR